MNRAFGLAITKRMRRLRPVARLTVGILLAGLLIGSTGTGVAQAQGATATWLDDPPRTFNTAEAAIPRSPAASGEIFPPSPAAMDSPADGVLSGLPQLLVLRQVRFAG